MAEIEGKLPAGEKEPVIERADQIDNYFDDLVKDLSPYTVYAKETVPIPGSKETEVVEKIDEKKTRERIKKEIETRLYERLKKDFPDTDINSVIFDVGGERKEDERSDLYKFLEALKEDEIIIKPNDLQALIDDLAGIILNKRKGLYQHTGEVITEKTAREEAEKRQVSWEAVENLKSFFAQGLENVKEREAKVAELKADASQLRIKVFNLEQEAKQLAEKKELLRQNYQIDRMLTEEDRKELDKTKERIADINLKLNGGGKNETKGLRTKLKERDDEIEKLQKVDDKLIAEIIKKEDLLLTGTKDRLKERLDMFKELNIQDQPLVKLREFLQDQLAQSEKLELKEEHQKRFLALHREVDFFEKSFEDAISTIEIKILTARKARIEKRLLKKMQELEEDPKNKGLLEEIRLLKKILAEETMDKRRIRAIERAERDILNNSALGSELQLGILQESKFLAERLPKIAQKRQEILDFIKLLSTKTPQEFTDYFKEQQVDLRKQIQDLEQAIAKGTEAKDLLKEELKPIEQAIKEKVKLRDPLKERINVLTQELLQTLERKEKLAQEAERLKAFINPDINPKVKMQWEKGDDDQLFLEQKQKIEAIVQQIDPLDAEIAEKNQEIQKLTQQTKAIDAEIVQKNQAIAEFNQQIDDFDSKIKQMKERLNLLTRTPYNVAYLQKVILDFYRTAGSSKFVNASEIRKSSEQQMLLARATIKSDTASPAEKARAEEDFIFHKAIVDLMKEEIHSPRAIANNKEIIAEAKRRQEQAEKEQKRESGELFDGVDEKIKTAIQARKEEIINKNGDCLHMMDQVVLFIQTNGAHMSEDLFKFLNDSRDDTQAVKIKKLFVDKAKKGLTDKELKKLKTQGHIKNAAVLELCAEARAIHARNLAMNKEQYGEFTEDRYGDARGVNAFTMRRSREDYNRETDLNANMTPGNIFRFFAFFYGAATTLANTLVSFRSGNWDNEYIALGGGIMYASYKGGDWIDNARDPEGMRFRLASDLSTSTKGKRILECFRNENEMKLVNMIDWKKVQKNPRKYFSSKQDRDKTKWQDASLSSFPTKDSVDEALFKATIQENIGGEIEAKQRYDFLRFIAYKEKVFPNQGAIQEMVYHAKRL